MLRTHRRLVSWLGLEVHIQNTGLNNSTVHDTVRGARLPAHRAPPRAQRAASTQAGSSAARSEAPTAARLGQSGASLRLQAPPPRAPAALTARCGHESDTLTRMVPAPSQSQSGTSTVYSSSSGVHWKEKAEPEGHGLSSASRRPRSTRATPVAGDPAA